MSPEKTSRARPPHLQRLKDYRRPKRTNVPVHVNRIVAVILCQNLCGRQLVHLTHPHGSTQVPNKALYRGGLWVLSHFIHPKQFGTFLKRLALPYTYDEILSGYEEDVSSIRYGFSASVKTDLETILRRHVVDTKGFSPALREAPARRHEPSSQEYRFL